MATQAEVDALTQRLVAVAAKVAADEAAAAPVDLTNLTAEVALVETAAGVPAPKAGA